MIDNVIHAATKHLLTQYLSSIGSGPWSIQGASITARTMTKYGLPADAVATRVLIEEPDAGWSVAIEVVQRSNKFWKFVVQNYYDDQDALGVEGVRLAYAEWLQAL